MVACCGHTPPALATDKVIKDVEHATALGTLTRSSGAGGGSEGEVILLGLPSGVGGARRVWEMDVEERWEGEEAIAAYDGPALRLAVVASLIVVVDVGNVRCARSTSA